MGGLGLAFASSQTVFASLPSDSPQTRLYEVAWYSGLALIGAVVLYFGNRNAHAVVGPITGGLLVASLAVYAAAFVLASSSALSLKFVDCIEAMLTRKGALPIFGKQEFLVWAVGASLWLVVFLLGLSRHFLDWPPC